MDNEKLTRLRERLERAYEAEKSALECQTTSNADGDVNTIASLAAIQSLIKDLEEQIQALESGGANAVSMFWELR